MPSPDSALQTVGLCVPVNSGVHLLPDADQTWPVQINAHGPCPGRRSYHGQKIFEIAKTQVITSRSIPRNSVTDDNLAAITQRNKRGNAAILKFAPRRFGSGVAWRGVRRRGHPDRKSGV